MPVVNQITRSPGLLNFNRFSPHTFHLDKKIEVFAAEGSLNHESPGQLKFRRFSARNHQFTLENQAYTTPHHIPWITLRLKCIHTELNKLQLCKFCVQPLMVKARNIAFFTMTFDYLSVIETDFRF